MVRGNDRTCDLAYKGTDALKLGQNTLKDAGDSSVIPSVSLPAPGAPNSLSHNRDIALNLPPCQVPVSTETPDGQYGPGDEIDITVEFAEPVRLDVIPVQDINPFIEIDAYGAAAVVVDAGDDGGGGDRHYTLIPDRDSLRVFDTTDPRDIVEVDIDPDLLEEAPNTSSIKFIDVAQIEDDWYAFVVAYRALLAFNVTDPENPVYVGSVLGGSTPPFSLGASVAVTAMQSGDSHYALVVSSGLDAQDSYGLTIVDVTDPADPEIVTVLSRAHNSTIISRFSATLEIDVVQVGGNPYALVPDVGSLKILDLAEPASPSLAATITNETLGISDLYVEFVDVAYINGTAYALVNNFDSSGNSTVHVIDVSDPAAPVLAGSVYDGKDGVSMGTPQSVAAFQAGTAPPTTRQC